MHKLVDAAEANLLQAIADSTLKVRPCPPLNVNIAETFTANGWIVNAGDESDCYLITEAGRQALRDWYSRRIQFNMW